MILPNNYTALIGLTASSDALLRRYVEPSIRRADSSRNLMAIWRFINDPQNPPDSQPPFKDCSDLMKPDTSIGGEIAAVSEVLNVKKGF